MKRTHSLYIIIYEYMIDREDLDMQFTFGKRESQLIKGIAIIAMFYHHFFGFSSWLSSECNFAHTYIGGRCIESDIASFCKICVGIYVFVSGYALFLQKSNFSNIKWMLKRITVFLCNYWMIFFVFIIFGVIFREPFPSIGRFLLQCFGISTGTVFDWSYFDAIHPVFAWYVSFYILFIVISPLLMKICKFNFVVDLFIVSGVLFGINFLAGTILPSRFAIIKILIATFATWGHIGMIGFLFAKYNMFDFIHKILTKYLSDMVLFVLLAVVIYHMYHLWNVEGKWYIYESDIVKVSYFAIFTPIFIYAVIYILNYINCKALNSILISLSNESTNMWFLHGLFFTPKKTIQWIAYLPKHPLLILVWTLALMYGCSIAIKHIFNWLCSVVRKRIIPIVKKINIQKH